MTERIVRDQQANYRAWSADQLAKSQFFREKLHSWEMMQVAETIDAVQGEDLPWELADFGISQRSWDRVVHRGIKPVTVFAHPTVLQTITRAVTYYRMLAMVSQKSMNNLGLPVTRYESGEKQPDATQATALALHLNQVISSLVEMDGNIDAREFDLWRGMAAGTQAQGSWQNLKGQRVELQVKSLIRQRLREKGLIQTEQGNRIELTNGRFLHFADEPDIALYESNLIQVAIEIKGGIDTAAILERVGAAIKSLSRAKEENPAAHTVLLMPEVSFTQQASLDLLNNQNAVNYWFTVEAMLNNPATQQSVFRLLGI